MNVDEDDYHRFYECPDNERILGPKAFPFLRNISRDTAEACPCMYFRGLIPPNKYNIPEPPTEENIHTFGTATQSDHQLRGSDDVPLLAFTDASGGPDTKDPRLRRVGWAAIIRDGPQASSTLDISLGAMGSLAGPVQTINRGELRATLEALNLTLGTIHIVTDSSYVQKGFDKIKRNKKFSGAHSDLWKQIVVHSRRRNIHILKVESHLDTHQHRIGSTPHWMIYGNLQADLAAEHAAADARLPREISERAASLDKAALSIIQHHSLLLANIMDLEPRAARSTEPAPSTRLSLQQKIEQSEHDIEYIDGRASCRRCRDLLPRTATKKFITDWVEGACAGPPWMTRSPTCWVGKHRLHASHDLVHYYDDRNFWLCTLCGHIARTSGHSLSTPCTRVRTVKGERTIRRAAMGLMPGDSRFAKTYNFSQVRHRGGRHRRC